MDDLDERLITLLRHDGRRSISDLAADLGVSLGGFAMGPVADRFSYGTMYAAGAGLAVLAACTALLNRPARSFAGVRGSSEAGHL